MSPFVVLTLGTITLQGQKYEQATTEYQRRSFLCFTWVEWEIIMGIVVEFWKEHGRSWLLWISRRHLLGSGSSGGPKGYHAVGRYLSIDSWGKHCMYQPKEGLGTEISMAHSCTDEGILAIFASVIPQDASSSRACIVRSTEYSWEPAPDAINQSRSNDAPSVRETRVM